MYDDGVEGQYYQPVHTFLINPKAIAIGELYGEVNLTTMEWRDGLLGIAVRRAVQHENENHQWVICDGPVDAVWIENLNTVLDDNKMLCLANSERIKLTPYVHMVFEVMDLSQASPATVSRCGMVYIDPSELRWMPYLKSWLDKFDETLIPPELKTLLLIEAFEPYIEEAFTFIKKFCQPVMAQVEVSKITMMCKIMESLFTRPKSIDSTLDKIRLKTYVYQIFVFALLWGLGGNLTGESRISFEVFLREKLFEEFEMAQLPTGDFWNVYISTQTRRVEMWQGLMTDFHYDKELPFFDILVPTLDTIRFGFVMDCLVQVNAPVMFTGDTGVGKSVIAKSELKVLNESETWVSLI